MTLSPYLKKELKRLRKKEQELISLRRWFERTDKALDAERAHRQRIEIELGAAAQKIFEWQGRAELAEKELAKRKESGK